MVDDDVECVVAKKHTQTVKNETAVDVKTKSITV